MRSIIIFPAILSGITGKSLRNGGDLTKIQFVLSDNSNNTLEIKCIVGTNVYGKVSIFYERKKYGYYLIMQSVSL